jgi:hypothetical protein
MVACKRCAFEATIVWLKDNVSFELLLPLRHGMCLLSYVSFEQLLPHGHSVVAQKTRSPHFGIQSMIVIASGMDRRIYPLL